MKALIVDDSQFVRRMVQGILLSSCKFDEVVQKADGESGLNELLSKPHKYDLVLLDWNMPEKDGIDVLLSAREAKIQTSIVMCTAAGKKENIIDAISAGADDYLVKPFDPSGLEEKVRKVLAKKKARENRIIHKSVLVVDDSSLVRTFVKSILQKDDSFTDIVMAEDGNKALDLYRKQPFDLILLDWELPGMQGIDILHAIREKDSTTPIIMATGKTSSAHMVSAFDAGASNFIAKPFNAPALLQKINQVMVRS